jgi:hypothetical protein
MQWTCGSPRVSVLRFESERGAGSAIDRSYTMPPLGDDEFRLLAYMRGYADRLGQRLDPNWVREQLEFDEARMRSAANALAKRGLAEFFDWKPRKIDLLFEPEIGEGPFMIRLTEHGWNYLRQEA